MTKFYMKIGYLLFMNILVIEFSILNVKYIEKSKDGENSLKNQKFCLPTIWISWKDKKNFLKFLSYRASSELIN